MTHAETILINLTLGTFYFSGFQKITTATFIASTSSAHPTQGACTRDAVPVVQELSALENEVIVAYDALLQCKVLVVAPVLSFICDNPLGAVLCSHLGATTKKNCRICLVWNDSSK